MDISKDTEGRLKEAYLKSGNRYPYKKNFGISTKEALLLLDNILPVPDITSIDDIRRIGNDYPSTPLLKRVLRTGEPYKLMLSTPKVLSAIHELYVEENMSLDEMLGELDLPKVFKRDTVKNFLRSSGIYHKDELRDVNRKKYHDMWRKDKSRIAEGKEKRRKTNLVRYGVENPMQVSKFKRRYMEANISNSGFMYARQRMVAFTPTSYVHSVEDSIRVTHDSSSLESFLREVFPDKEKFTINEIATITGRSYRYLCSIVNTSMDFIKQSSQGLLHESMMLFLESLGFVKGVDFIMNDRVVIYPKEIDFYFPKQRVGIEVNDLWTHNSTINTYGGPVKPKNYHMDKSKLAKEKGIRLIHAWEHYFDNPDQYEVLKNAIKHALGISKYRVYARNTYVKEVTNTSLKDFFNKNNIQGFRGAKTAYALFDKKTDEVLMAYSVGNPHFSHQKYDLELIRGASKLDTTIVGGASKLWKYIIDNNPEVNSIVYYIDRNIYNGSSISTLEGNLELVSTQIGFWNYFVDTKEMKNRQPGKHKEIKELVEQGKVWEVYNAGTETYVWTRNGIGVDK